MQSHPADFLMSSDQFLAQKLSGENREAKTDVWPPQLANIAPCCVFLIQIINGNCIFSHSLAKLANMVQDKKVDKQTPPTRGGLKGTEHGTRRHVPEHAASFRNLATETTSTRRHSQLRSHARTNETNTICWSDSDPKPHIYYPPTLFERSSGNAC